MQTIYRLEARWTGGPPPAAVAAALEALPRYDGDALMNAVRVLSPAAMHTGFLVHELRDRCELRRVRRDEHLWTLELRGPADGQADVCCVLDFLDALGFRHVSVTGPDPDGDLQVLSATLWRQRFDDSDVELVDFDFDDDDDEDLQADADALDEDAEGDDHDGPYEPFELHEPGYDQDDGNRLPALGPLLPASEQAPLRVLFAALAASDDGAVGDCLETFATVADRLQALHEQHDSGVDLDAGGAAVFRAMARGHGPFLESEGIRTALYGYFAGIAAQALEVDRLGSLRLLAARAAQFTTVLSGLLADPEIRRGDDSAGLVGIAAAAAGFVDLGED